MTTLASLLVFTFWVGPLIGCCADQDARIDQRKVISFVQESYQANLDAFEYCTCRFVHTKGKAESVEAALKGLIREPVKRDGLWLFNGQKVRYELKCQVRPTLVFGERKGSEVRLTAECDSTGYLTDGSHVLTYAVDVPIANISPPETSAGAGIYYTPFTVGVMGNNGEYSPARLLEDALRGSRDWEITDVRGRGKSEARIGIAIGQPGKPRTTRYEFDPAKGCLPILFSACYGGTTTRAYEAHVTDIASCSKGRWFPKRTVLVWDPDVKQERYRVDILEVNELDVDTPPANDQFVLRLPRGTSVYEPRGTDSYYQVARDELVSVDELGEVLNKCRQRREQMAGLTPGPRVSGRGKIVFWALLVIGVVAMWLGYRFRLRGSQNVQSVGKK